jgi:hypothetical protein
MNLKRLSVWGRRLVQSWDTRAVKHWWQRRQRGWDDSDTWSLDHSVAKLILPRLKRFREVTIGYPGQMSEQEWDAILLKMIAAFEFAASEERWSASHTEYQKHQEGINLFAEYFWHLWW